MIFPTSSIQGFVNIMKSLESINKELENQYCKLYGDLSDNEPDENFSSAQLQINRAYDEVATLLSKTLILKE